MKKKKNTAKKDKSAQKSAREALRFQMLWEAKKLYPNAGSELPERIDMECSIMNALTWNAPLWKKPTFFLT